MTQAWIGTVFLAAALGGGISAPAAASAAGWRDDFDSSRLASRWTWETPRPGPKISLTAHPGCIRIIVPQSARGFNEWVGVHEAAFLKTPAPAGPGNWNLDARISLADWKPDSNFHLALVVGFSQRIVLAWGPFFSRSLYPDQKKPGLWAEPTGIGAYIRTQAPVQDVELRISRRGDSWHCLYRKPGDPGWTDAGCYYAGGLVPRFVGIMGKSFGANPAGALDVDYIAVTPVKPRPPRPALRAEITLSPRATGQAPIPETQRGGFLELLGNCIFRGLWDEMLANRKFIGAGGAHGLVWGWQAEGAAKAYQPDRRLPYSEPQSQRITLGAAPGGVRQEGLAFRKGQRYRVRLALRVRGEIRHVRVALTGRGQPLLEHRFPVSPGTWQTLTWRSPALAKPVADGGFVVSAAGPGTLWLGAVSLMRDDNVGGFRKALLDRLRQAPPPIIRWPGGNMASGYHWRDGIGPADRRPPRWDRAWKAWVYNDMGTDEFLALCRLLGAAPCICVNCGEGTAAEAADWVEYCNGGPDTPMGRLRAAGGHPKPYGVRYWDLGNEIWGPWQLGHTGPEQYGLRAVEFARAMRRKDPNIVLVASGAMEREFGDWNSRMLRICGPFVDMLSVHHYTEYPVNRCTDANWARVVGAPGRIASMLLHTAALAEQAAGKPLPLAFDEWNSIPLPHAHRGGEGLPDALYAAGILQALQRCGRRVPIANYALLVNPIGALRADATRVFETPVFQVFRIFHDFTGRRPVPLAVRSPQFRGTDVLGAAASLSRNRSSLCVTLINRHPRRALQLEWRGRAVTGGLERRVRVARVSGPEPWARNTFEAPDTVRLVRRTLSLREFLAAPLPPASVTGVRIPLPAAPGP